MPDAGEYLLSNVGFSSSEQPYISLQQNNEFIDLLPIGKALTLCFTTNQRYCTGWGDMAAGKRYACPGSHTTESKYEQCSACQQRTGFNPAFYHARSVSAQQEARNLEPHVLYLAYFTEGMVKVGISYAKRGNARLLEQGARSALILGTFPSAHIARQYEARIAQLKGISETVQLSRKIAALSNPYSPELATTTLTDVRAEIEVALETTFDKNSVLTFDSLYFPKGLPYLNESHDRTSQAMISGVSIGMLGSLLFCIQQDTPLLLSLKKHTGYKVAVSYEEITLPLPARQISLF